MCHCTEYKLLALQGYRRKIN